jgi:uncharacterized protein with ParB-like and HNH nuclease domain
MAIVPRIESRNLSIADLFKYFYSVPDFQREYVWEKDNVNKLIEDITLELYDENDLVEEAEYFLGSIVVFLDESGISQLIDGQQRLTTIYLTFCVIRDYLIELGEPSQSIEGFIAGVSQDIETGKDVHNYKLTLQYGDGSEVLKDIASGKLDVIKIDTKKSASVKRIVEAYQAIYDFLSDRFVQDADLIRKFSSNFSQKVKLIKIETPNLKNALKVFETINARGVGLSSLDLLKNYLFISISQKSNIDPKDYWEKLKKQWDKLTKNLHSCGEQPMQFLRYYIMSHYDVNLSNNFPEEAIYEWITSNASKYKIDESPFDFIEELVKVSEYYVHFAKAENIDGSENYYLKNIKKLQGRYSQHFVLLLAGKSLSMDLFTKLCHQVENLLFVYTITRYTRKEINIVRNFSQWSQKLRHIRTSEDFDHFINEYFTKELRSLSRDFDLIFFELTESKIARSRMRYILARLSQYLDEQAYGSRNTLDSYLNKSVTIEHILPKSSKKVSVDTFDKTEEYSSYVAKFGNLALLEKTINSSISDNDYKLKKEGYRQSNILLTRSIAETPKVGKNTQFDQTIKSLGITSFEKWDSEAIEKRQNILAKLARKVWGLPEYSNILEDDDIVF